ncbi:FERM and PDZ domain-containing protein 1 [Erpetoichthys calabaricus]|uniref:FERM and PDZ domain-containing protein 1 n=1 Tax=Erpetoichthys calabaricus TaxID=27687 RepID=UPI002234A855|nr:FERM and PDZ domain-containing protein 1 [Erpetoichthys calabaricus]
MEKAETNPPRTRKTSRVEQVVGRWLRRSRDNTPREKLPGDDPADKSNQQVNIPLKITLHIHKDVLLGLFRFQMLTVPPFIVKGVPAGGPTEERLLPGDQIVKINEAFVDAVSGEQALDIIRESKDLVAVTVLRHTSGPKSSFITEEKRARLKSNPVKVRFAEEVKVNGHSQGSSFLFLPNVLKIYLENGQTKAFRFESLTTVKDIILTLQEKLSIRCIEHFALALEEQYNIAKLHLLHEDERIQQVVRRKESHNYRCLFRVCFIPKDPFDLFQEDPVAFEYLYLQSCSDVLHERFAVEMKCNVALRLAALQIQERIHASGQPQKFSLKYIEKDWGIENFISPTLLRNMREKDLKKAITYHIKMTQSFPEPGQKQLISAAQARLNYLKILGELKTYGGKIFNATMMLQDRESSITLLVGAKYGISQIINNKLSIMTTLTEFLNISRVELIPESSKVSSVKIYLQDIKPISLLMESLAAKDLACLVAGYYKLFIDSGASIFSWTCYQKMHKMLAEEGYESRGCSDSEESSEVDSSQDLLSDVDIIQTKGGPGAISKEKGWDNLPLCDRIDAKDSCQHDSEDSVVDNSISEASDSGRAESREDSRLKLSFSSDSMDALEEDDLVACSSSSTEFYQIPHPYSESTMHPENVHFEKAELNESVTQGTRSCDHDGVVSLHKHILKGEVLMDDMRLLSEHLTPSENTSNSLTSDCVFTFSENTMQYYNLCANVTPDSATDKHFFARAGRNTISETTPPTTCQESTLGIVENNVILEPPPGFGDSSSDEEFFDAPERLTPMATWRGHVAFQNLSVKENISSTIHLSDIGIEVSELDKGEETEDEASVEPHTLLDDADYTSWGSVSESRSHLNNCEKETPTISSVSNLENEPTLLETKSITHLACPRTSTNKTFSSGLMEMEPDTMETKLVTETLNRVSPVKAIRCRSNPEETEGRTLDSDVSQNSQKEVCHDANHEAREISEEQSHYKMVTLQMEEVQSSHLSVPGLDSKHAEDHLSQVPAETGTHLDCYINPSSDGFEETASDSATRHLQSTSIENISINSTKRGISVSHECLLLLGLGGLVPRRSPTFSSHKDLSLNFTGLSGVVSHLSTSTLRTKIQSLPLYLSQSHDSIKCNLPETQLVANEQEFGTFRSSYTFSFTNNTSHPLGATGSTPCLSTFQPFYKKADPCLSSLVQIKHESSPLVELLSKSKAFNDDNGLEYVPRPGQSEALQYSLNAETTVIRPKGLSGTCGCETIYTQCFTGSKNVFMEEKSHLEYSSKNFTPLTIPPLRRSHLNGELIPLFSQVDQQDQQSSSSFHSSQVNHILKPLMDKMYSTPEGFSLLHGDISKLLSVLDQNSESRSQHRKEACRLLFSRNKQLLMDESRKLMSSCQKVIRADQSEEEMLQSLSESFHLLVRLMSICLWLTDCAQCRRIHCEVLGSLRNVVVTYEEFVQSAEKACGRNCQDFAIKLLARQCTTLTAGLFCLTQLLRPLP